MSLAILDDDAELYAGCFCAAHDPGHIALFDDCGTRAQVSPPIFPSPTGGVLRAERPAGVMRTPG